MGLWRVAATQKTRSCVHDLHNFRRPTIPSHFVCDKDTKLTPRQYCNEQKQRVAVLRA